MQSTPTTPVPEGAAEATEAEATSTVEVPISAIGAAKDGDTVQFKVISRDDQNGVVNLAPVGTEAPEMGGSDDMAAEFGKEETQPA